MTRSSGKRKGYGVVQIIAYAIFAGFGLMMLYVGLTELTAQRRLMATAEPIDAVITRSEVIRSESSNTDRRLLRNNSTVSYTPEVRFEYILAGRIHESDMLRPTIIVQAHASRESAAEELAAFPIGARVKAWVDPADPERGFLIKERSAGPVVFVVLGVLLPPLTWLASRLV